MADSPGRGGRDARPWLPAPGARRFRERSKNRSRPASAIGGAIDESLGEFGDLALLARVAAAWKRIVPSNAYANTQVMRVVDGALVVHVRSSAWASELSFALAEIRHAIASLTNGAVKDVRFRVGPVRAAKPPVASARPRPTPPSGPMPESIARALASIGDDDLRAAISRAINVSLAKPPKR